MVEVKTGIGCGKGEKEKIKNHENKGRIIPQRPAPPAL
jgi:hypothetical protein